MSQSTANIIDSRPTLTATTLPVPVALELPGRGDKAKTFPRNFARELLHGVLLVSVAVLVSGGFYLGHSALQRYRAQQQQTLNQTEALIKRMDEQQRLIAQLSERQDQLTHQTSGITKTQSDIKHNNQPAFYGPALPTRIWNSYSKGICLIAGSYILIDDATGLPLRHPEVEVSPQERLLTTGTMMPLTPKGNGKIFQVEFVGTGFHVGDGYLLTNRHLVSEPWLTNLRAQVLISNSSATARMDKLQAFFPGQREPIALKFRTASVTTDVAVCTLKNVPSTVPALPLDENLGAVEIGRQVVMMGYPTGPERMLALLPEAEAIEVENEYGGSLVTLLYQLAERKLINPLTTQGHITDLYKNRIVFDAATAEGSSGTPMLGESGKVIGITFAVLVDNRSSSFAVPIAEGVEELKKAGWKPQRESD